MGLIRQFNNKEKKLKSVIENEVIKNKQIKDKKKKDEQILQFINRKKQQQILNEVNNIKVQKDKDHKKKIVNIRKDSVEEVVTIDEKENIRNKRTNVGSPTNKEEHEIKKEIPHKDLLIKDDLEKVETVKEIKQQRGKKSEPRKKVGIDESPSKIENINYIEKEIIMILDDTIKENNYQLKLLDSDLELLKRKSETSLEPEEIDELEKEFIDLIDRLETIKRSMEILERNLDLKFYPSEDNYLIYLIDEYKDKIRDDILLKGQFKDFKKEDSYKNIMENIVDIEYRKQQLEERIIEKRDDLELRDEELKEFNKESLKFEEISSSIKAMTDMQKQALDEINELVDKSVNIEERIEVVTKYSGSLLERFLLIGALWKMSSKKEANGMAAASALLALDMIKEICTPKTEEIKRYYADIEDYQNTIKNSLSDSKKIDILIKDSLSNISSLKGDFERDFGEFSHLREFKDTMNRLDEVEKDMEERQDYMIRINKEMQYQLEKNDAKVKNYGSIAA